MKKIKVLVSAYACEPHKGSEPGVGWNWVKQICRFDELWVITRANNKEVIEEELQNLPLKNVHFIYYDLPSYIAFWKKGRRGIHLYYYLWQIGIFFVTHKLQRKNQFDIIHHVTLTNYWLPSFLVLLPPKFVWGPLAGGDFTPRPFLTSFSTRGKIYEWVRNFVCRLFEFDPFVRLTAHRSAAVLATTPQTAQRLKKLKIQRIELLSQVGLPEKELKSLHTIRYSEGKTFRLLSIGNLLHLKGYHLGLFSFALIQEDAPDSEYWIIGEGPERKSLEKQAAALHIETKVKFWGQIPRQEVLKKLGYCNVLVHPSLHDSGAMVCSEAMGAGLPVICLDLGGPALQVTEETGFKIAAISPDQVIKDMAEAMRTLAKNPELLKKMGEAGRRRVMNHFNWEEKGNFINLLYGELLQI